MERRIQESKKVRRLADQPFFKELAVRIDAPWNQVQAALLAEGMFAGPYFEPLGVAPDDAMLLCATEARSKDEIDQLIDVLSQL